MIMSKAGHFRVIVKMRKCDRKRENRCGGCSFSFCFAHLSDSSFTKVIKWAFTFCLFVERFVRQTRQKARGSVGRSARVGSTRPPPPAAAATPAEDHTWPSTTSTGVCMYMCTLIYMCTPPPPFARVRSQRHCWNVEIGRDPVNCVTFDSHSVYVRGSLPPSLLSSTDGADAPSVVNQRRDPENECSLCVADNPPPLPTIFKPVSDPQR